MATQSDLDIFISYSSRDLAAIQRVVQAFQDAGLTVWWDQRIERGLWATEIEQKIEAAKWVVAFLTESSVNSTYDYIFAEMRVGRERGKLIPVRVGNLRIPLAYEGLVALIQNYTFSDFADIVGDPAFLTLCQACGASVDSQRSGPVALHAEQRLRRWLAKNPTQDQVALALATAVLEHAPFAVIRGSANELIRVLQPDPPPGASSPRGANGSVASAIALEPILVPRSSRLQAIDAELFQEAHPRFNVSQECTRFVDGERSAVLLHHAWTELDQLHEPLIRWLDHVSGTASAEGRSRLGLALGLLAQREFASVFDRILRRWAVDDHGARREVADIALSVASFEPAVADAIRSVLRDWSNAATSTKYLKAAVELSCGYTGARIARSSIETLKAASRAKRADLSLIDTMKAAIDQLLANALESGDNSLLDLPRLIEELAGWVEHSAARQERHLPMYLFLHMLEDLPLTAPKSVVGGLSLAALVADNRTLQLCTRVFAAALRDPGSGETGPRDHAARVLTRWMELQKSEQADNDPVLKLAGALVSNMTTARERDRCIYLFRRAYSPADLVPHKSSAPVSPVG
jgi:hypothetical protein